ncbi:MAG: archaeosortase/exosortase family protein, partial [Alphaproteobacteria bacterium]
MNVAEKREGGPAATDMTVAPAGTAMWRNWRTAGTVLVCGYVALIVLFWGAASAAVEVWYDSATFNHGFLILPICGWLAWTRRHRLHGLAPTPSFWGLAPMAVLALVWFVGDVMGLLLIQQFALVGMFQVLVFTVIGWRAARAMAFPLFYLVFAVPFGDFMIAPLQDFTAVFVVEGLRLV